MSTQTATAPRTTKRKRSQLTEVWRRFMKNHMAVGGLVILGVLILVACFAPQLAPYGFDDQDYSIALQDASLAHLCGTDNLGRDIFSRLLYGSRVSLSVGLISVGIGVTVGGLLGALAAFYGSKIDNTIMRLLDILMAIPSTILAISICAALGPGMTNTMIAVGISGIPKYARVVRSAVITAKQQEYVEAARAIGAGDRRIIFRHLIPNSMAPIIVQASMGIASAILAAASMSFIGLGIQPPNPEWGAMLTAGRGYIRDYPHMVFYPGLAIMITVFALNLFGDGLRDALDPRLKR